MIDAMTWWDIFGSLRAVAAFAAILLVPGFCLAQAIDLFGFRARSLADRLAWAVALSFAITPLVAVELTKYTSLALVCWLSLLVAAWFVWLQARNLNLTHLQPLAPWHRFAIAGAVAWSLITVASLVDVGIGNRLYLSVTVYDHALRTAFVDSVLRTGVPPANPLYWPGHPAPMRYYYFWYVITAIAAKLAHATAREAFIASAVWGGFGLAAILHLYCRLFLDPRPATSADHTPVPRAGRWPRTLLALALLFVAGLDIIAVLVKAMLRLPTDGDMDWWTGEQVSTWAASLLWVPHHIAGLICGLFGFLLIWLSRSYKTTDCVLCALIAGLSFASAFGLSAWVALAFAMVLLAWLFWVLLLEPGSRPRIPALLGSALVATLAVLPYAFELKGPSSSAGTDNQHLLRFHIRQIIESDVLLLFPATAHFAHTHPRLEYVVVSLLLLLPGYITEFGFYVPVLLAGIRSVRSGARHNGIPESTRTAVFLTLTGLCVATFFRSTVIGSNDFGFRSILIPQFFLLLLAVLWLEGALPVPAPRPGSMARAMLWIGVAGTVYQVIGLRLYLPVEDALHRPRANALGEYSMALRRAFDDANSRIPSSAVLQFATQHPSPYFNFAELMEARRPIGTAFPQCDAPFGGELSRCAAVESGAASLFAVSAETHALSAASASAICSQLGIDDLVATRWDAVWYDPSGWVWGLPSVTDTGQVRIVRCRP